MLRLICGYAQQGGRSLEEKQSFYEGLKCVWVVNSAGEFNGHVGRHIDGGYGVGQRNVEGRMLFEFCLEKKLCVSNTWLKR